MRIMFRKLVGNGEPWARTSLNHARLASWGQGREASETDKTGAQAAFCFIYIRFGWFCRWFLSFWITSRNITHIYTIIHILCQCVCVSVGVRMKQWDIGKYRDMSWLYCMTLLPVMYLQSFGWKKSAFSALKHFLAEASPKVADLTPRASRKAGCGKVFWLVVSNMFDFQNGNDDQMIMSFF